MIALAACVLVFARTMDRSLNHDEHQFLAPAALLAREGLEPWRDYQLFHLPNLILAYAAADRLTGDLVFGAKLVSFAATAFVICLVVWLAMRGDPRRGVLIGGAAVLVLLGDPLFLFTAGKTWNHEVPTALLIAAGASLVLASGRDRLWQTACAGVLAGLATGCRLTFAPMLIGLFVFVLLFPVPWRRRFMHAGVLTIAATIALGPSLYFLATQTEAFIFGNLEFPRLRLTDPTDTRVQKTVSLWRKLRFFFKEIMLPSWPVFLPWLAFAIRPGWQWLRTRRFDQAAAGLSLVLFPFVLAGCFSPARYQKQHFFVFVPLLMVTVLAILMSQYVRHKILTNLLIGGLALISIVRGWAEYVVIENLAQPQEWFTSRLARAGSEIRAHAPGGQILTLAPALPLAGGLSIYREFATGAFAWRSARFVPAERRRQLHMIAPDDLDEFLRARPPAAVLTGVEEADEEAPLIAWARRNNFSPKPLKKGRVLWLPDTRVR
ncbi:MAG: hypothetical protein ABMA13_23150 [Chthoniobacteraceae bacterium]